MGKYLGVSRGAGGAVGLVRVLEQLLQQLVLLLEARTSLQVTVITRLVQQLINKTMMSVNMLSYHYNTSKLYLKNKVQQT